MSSCVGYTNSTVIQKQGQEEALKTFILRICLLYIYYTTGNIVLKHQLSGDNLAKTIDEDMMSCFPADKMSEWRIDFGSRLRVAVFFLRLSTADFSDIEDYQEIEAGFGEFSLNLVTTLELDIFKSLF